MLTTRKQYCVEFNARHEGIGAKLYQIRPETQGSMDKIALCQDERCAVGPYLRMREILKGEPGSWWTKLEDVGYVRIDPPPLHGEDMAR